MKFKMATTAGLNLTPIDIKHINNVDNVTMIIPGQFGLNCPSGFREEAF
jgi:hypothetical protein